MKTMNNNNSEHTSEMKVEIFSTCPQSSQADSRSYLRQVADVARWSEKAGCKGILVYTDNSLVDPWLVSQIIIENAGRLCPLIAVQPIYMSPYTAAKMIASFGYIYNRRIYLNMLAGGFKNDLTALGDDTPHDKRYDRAVEYTLIIKRLLASNGPVSFSGEYYRVSNLRMTPPLAPELFPGILISGSSDQGVAAARAIGATAVRYPIPSGEYGGSLLDDDLKSGLRVGVIARADENEAWNVAYERFPVDRKGELAHQLAMKVSDSVWHKQLSELGGATENNPYWLIPFKHYKTFCPYLVGDYSRVATELARYMALGFTTFILDIPPNEEELHHTGVVFKQAAEQALVKEMAF